MDVARVGQAGLMGWREKVGDVVAPRVARRTPLSVEQIRALIGALFFTLAFVYVIRTGTRVAQRLRGG